MIFSMLIRGDREFYREEPVLIPAKGGARKSAAPGGGRQAEGAAIYLSITTIMTMTVKRTSDYGWRPV